jgi:hypothetical protein
LDPEWSYCVEQNWGIPLSVSTPEEPVAGSDPSPTIGNGIKTPTPAMPGLSKDCNEFHLVVDGEVCSTIAKDTGISIDDFLEWNTKVGGECESLWLNSYVCVGVIGSEKSGKERPNDEAGDGPIPPTTTTSPGSGNGVQTPTPVMPKIIADCDDFHLVEEGEICATIAKDYGITLDDFLKWNPVVGEKCDGLWKDAYVCVGILYD